MLHYMLPESAMDAKKARAEPVHVRRHRDPAADRGAAGAPAAIRKRMVVRLAGGAQVLDSQGVFQIGKRNYLAARKILWKAGILIAAEAVGGEVSRTTRLEVATGRMWVREGGGTRAGAKWRRRTVAAVEAPTESGGREGATMAYSVLIVDDSPVMRSFIRRVMTLSGFEVGECLEAANGEEALAQLSAHAVDVILTDINMPKMNGEELLRRLVADGRSARPCPTLVISTDATNERICG